MNDIVKYELEHARTAFDRLATAFDKKEVHPDAVGPVTTHLREMAIWMNNFATGLTSKNSIEDFLSDNPPPLRSPDIHEYDDEDDDEQGGKG